jgi:membrane associated rhomboid family serine protease
MRSPFSLTPWVRGLVVANAAVFLLQLTVFTGPWFLTWFAFHPHQPLSHAWGVVTYMFVHGGFLHLAFNMLMLVIFGPAVEERMGGSMFAAYYFVGGIGGAVFSLAVALVTPVAPFVGASAAVFGVSLAFAYYWPNARIFVFPLPIPVKAKWLVAFLAATNLLAAIRATDDGVAHLAHLGGLLFGFLFLKSEATMRARMVTVSSIRPPTAAVHSHVREPATRSSEAASTSRPKPLHDEVDRVLDKISESGLDSLTPEERRLLDEVSRRLRDD